MRYKSKYLAFYASFLVFTCRHPFELRALNTQSSPVLRPDLLIDSVPSRRETPLSFDDKLERRIVRFDTLGRTLLASVLDVALEYELPIGIEYLDREATARPLNLEVRDQSVREILVAIVAQVPEYRVTFSEGVIDIYAVNAREDRSNLLNRVIKSFVVNDLDTHDADLQLLCELAREVGSAGACGGSIALGQWGPLKVTVHMQNAKVYEILNAIVAQNGKAFWVVLAPPDGLSKTPVANLWHIYPLENPFKEALLDRLANVRPPTMF